MAKKGGIPNLEPVERELDYVKRLLILLLVKAGTKHSEIAKAMNVDAATITRIIPARQIKPFPNRSEE